MIDTIIGIFYPCSKNNLLNTRVKILNDNMKVKIHNKKIVYNGFFKLENVTLQYEQFDGSMSPKVKRLNLLRGDAATAVVYHKGKKTILLTKQFRYSTNKKGPGWILELPAGMIRKDEEPDKCLQRELIEEIGYKVNKLQPISTMYMSPGGCDELMYFFYTELDEGQKVSDGGGAEDEYEDIKIIEMPISEINSYICSGEIRDGKTMFGLLWFLYTKM